MGDVISFAIDRSEREAADAAVQDVGIEWGARRRSVTTVLDTFDGRLHAAGLQLRVVVDGARRLVLVGSTAVEQPLPGRALPVRAGDLPAGPVGDRVRQVIGLRALAPLGVVSSMRLEAVVGGEPGAAPWLVQHQALSLDGHRVQPAVVLEVRRVPGGRRRARQFAAALEAEGLTGAELDVVGVAFAASGREFAGFENFPVVPLDPDMPSAVGFRAVLDRLGATIEANWDGVIARTDPEYLHDLRVAVRRSRTILAAGKQVLSEVEADDARVRLAWLGAQTSLARDLDVYIVEWGRYTAGLSDEVIADLTPLRQLLQQRAAEAHAQMAAALTAPSARSMISGWRTWLETTHSEVGELGHQPLGATVAQVVLRAQRILVQRGRLITPETPAAQVHDLRKDAKRLRYVLECFGSLMPTDAQRRFVKRLKALQDNLGEHQDAEVHVAQLGEFAHQLQQQGAGHEVLLAIGRLTERQDARRSAARREFAVRFAEYDTKATTKALFEAIDHIH